MAPQQPFQGSPFPASPYEGDVPRRGRRRRGSWLKLLLILIVALLAVFVVPTPWAFHIGGRFTPLMQWSGLGTVQASNGGRYVLFTALQGGMMDDHGRPSCSFHGCQTLRGAAKLCAENGRTYNFDITGGVSAWWSTDGAHTTVDLVNQENATGPLPDGWVVALHGTWQGPALELSSPDNSFTEAFTRAGAVRSTTSTADAGTASLTLRYGTAGAFESACHALATAR